MNTQDGMPEWEVIAQHVQRTTQACISTSHVEAVAGGCINRTYRLGDRHGQCFIKLNDVTALAMFEAERDGLNEIIASNTIAVPRPLCVGTTASHAFLALEYIAMQRSGDAGLLGEQLAAMHRCQHERFGWHRDNTIGSTPQSNLEEADWVRFWREHRLGYQLRLVGDHGGGVKLRQNGERLLESLDEFFAGYQPRASLLHGDLWSGNYGYDAKGRPVIFDPAVYFGDRETDIAMTELFGGFPPRFYEAYQSAWPLDSGYRVRRTLYNLYHVLNHYNLFGGGYLSQASTMIDELLAEIR